MDALGFAISVDRLPDNLFHGVSKLRLWKVHIEVPIKLDCKSLSLRRRCTALAEAVAAAEPRCLVDDLDRLEAYQSSNDDFSDKDGRESMRSRNISVANRGKVPWNKGRKHTAETLQRIRERTKIAMQDPTVKMKLANLGHAHSEETKAKIGLGVREGWECRHRRLRVQEKCLFEWQNIVAESSRQGYAGEHGLQWDSYDVLNEQLKQQWLESIEIRKAARKPKGSKRAPKSIEQRKKISEAIAAKWADPGYRKPVCSGLAKYHSTPVGAQNNATEKSTSTSQSKDEALPSEKAMKSLQGIDNETINRKELKFGKNRNTIPSYQDSSLNSKLDLVKQVKPQREAMENQKKAAIRRAEILITEAEKAAEALEVFALKSAIAQASLVETKNLVAEAKLKINSIDAEGLQTQIGKDDTYLSNNVPFNCLQASLKTLKNIPSFDCDDFSQASSIRKPVASIKNPGNSTERLRSGLPSSTEPKNGLEGVLSIVNGMMKCDNQSPKGTKREFLQPTDCKSSAKPATKTKKKWVQGRLIEVQVED